MSTEAPATPASPAQPSAPPSGPRPHGSTWSVTWHGVRTVARLELRQRVRSTRWIVSLIVFGLVVGLVTTLTWAFTRNLGSDMLLGGASNVVGPTMFGFIVFFVLFLGLLVSPTLSATAVNGDRNAGTLATLQITLLSATEIVLGKLLASWVASLAFLAVSLPFIAWAFLAGGNNPAAVVVTVLLLAALLAVVCGIGLGFSALTTRTAGSAVLTYVSVASLTVLSLVVFGLSVPLVSGDERVRVYESDWSSAPEPDPETGWVEDPPCEWTEREQYVVHTERTWWLLAINPFVVVADAAPPAINDENRSVVFDPLAAIREGVRTARQGPPAEYDYCWQEMSPEEQAGMAGVEAHDGAPVWPWGLAANLLLGAGGVLLAIRRLQIPYRHLPKGTRVA